MKKISYLLMLVTSFLVFAHPVTAQQEKLTTKTATKDKGYKCLNIGEPIVIYQYTHTAHPPKAAEQYPTRYFFATSASDELQPLTLGNLKKTYPTSHSFHDALDANFKQDKELADYDDFHKMYKINHLLQMNPK